MAISFLAYFLAGAPSFVSKAAEGNRPNILIAFADDWGRYASAYAKLEPGGPSDVVQTPHFDRIAREGVLFRNAFVNAPSCTPCRSALLSGQYFWRTGRGAILQGAVWDDAIPTFPLLLKKAGYHIGHTAKVWSPGTPANAPYGGKEHAYNQSGSNFNRFSQFADRAPSVAEGRAALLEEVRGNFRDFLEDRTAGQPFCYWFGPTNCHRKWVRGSGKKHWGLNPDDSRGKLPPFLPDVPVVREDFCDYLGEVQAFDAMLGVLLEELARLGELDTTLIVVSGDHGIPGFPRGKCNLYDFGVAVPLAMRWGKNIPPNRVVDDFVNLMDLAPTFLEAATEPVAEIMTGRSLIPVATSSRQGLVDASRDFVVVGRERHVAAARPGHLPYPQRAIRTRDYLYIRNYKPDRWPMGTAPGFGRPDAQAEWPAFETLEQDTFAAFADMDAGPAKAWLVTHRHDPGMERIFQLAFARRPAEELYDLSSDPHQTTNVAADPDHASQRDALSTRLTRILTETGDPRLVNDGARYE